MKIKNYTVWIVIVFLISACSQSPKRPKFSENFVTYIEADGIKKFSYTLIVNKPSGVKSKGSGRHSGNGSGKGRGNRSSGEQHSGKNGKGSGPSKQNFQKRMQLALSESAFCREGHVELDSFADREMSQFKGQCNDKATYADKKKFPNQ